MNSSDRVSENTKGRFRTVIGAGLFILCAGFLAGVALDANYRPNRILLYINADGKVSLSPNPGDIISFESFDEEQGAKVAVNYTADVIPCDPKGGPNCVYAPFDDGPDVYLFGCTSTTATKDGTGNVTNCFDPQYGPKCRGCPGGQMHMMDGHFSLLGKFSLFRHILLTDLKGLFLSPAKRMLPANLGGSTAPTPPPPAPSNVIEVATKCNGNAPAVYLSGSSTPTTSIPARPWDTITWNNYDRDYAITNLSVCTQSEMPSSGGNNQSCTIKGGTTNPVTYTLTMTCNNVKSGTTGTISLP